MSGPGPLPLFALLVGLYGAAVSFYCAWVTVRREEASRKDLKRGEGGECEG